MQAQKEKSKSSKEDGSIWHVELINEEKDVDNTEHVKKKYQLRENKLQITENKNQQRNKNCFTAPFSLQVKEGNKIV